MDRGPRNRSRGHQEALWTVQEGHEPPKNRSKTPTLASRRLITPPRHSNNTSAGVPRRPQRATIAPSPMENLHC
eukprot:7877371-Pyramimonas_sp.AAC.1